MALQDELYRMYVAQVYPVLLNNDPHYRARLFNCGVDPTGGLTQGNQANFENEMKLQAWLGACEIEKSRGLEPNSIRTKVLIGPQVLYRSVNSGTKDTGIWWFSEKVAKRCEEEAAKSGQSKAEWLRNALAVCYNWNTMDGMQRIRLHAGEQLPAVIGIGLPMPFNVLKIHRGRIETPPDDYWKNIRKTLLGGELQIVLPWIPVRRVSPTPIL